jgi:tetratricopeptide (TPR) repeat protein
VHGLLEARHHLLHAGDIEDAGRVTEDACNQLHTWGAWDQEASLIYDTLAWLPADSPRQAAWIHHLGVLAHERGDYDEAARRYRRALDIFERLGDQAGTATSYHQLGQLAQARGDYDEAARQYQRALDIGERLGDQAGTATSYSQLGNLEVEHGGSVITVVTRHVKALAIRLRLGQGIPRAMYSLRRLAAYRRELGPEPFTGLLAQAAGDTHLTETITSLLDLVDAADDGTS